MCGAHARRTTNGIRLVTANAAIGSLTGSSAGSTLRYRLAYTKKLSSVHRWTSQSPPRHSMITDSTTQGLQTDEAFPAYRSNPAIPEQDELAMASHGRVLETEVEVRRNPWITDVTDEDPVAQYEFGMRIRDQVDAANLAVIAIRRVRAQLDERLQAADDDETLIAAAERLREAAFAVEADIYQVRNRSNQDPLNLPIKVNNRLAKLLSISERGDGRPGSGLYPVLEIMGGWVVW